MDLYTLEETRLSHAIISEVTATKLPLCCVIGRRRKKNNKLRKNRFFEICSTFEFFTFWISYGTQSFLI